MGVDAFGADTIFAIAAGGGRSALTVIRLSGPMTASCLAMLAGSLPPPRRARLSSLRARSGELLDRGLALWFPAPGSYTGEDSAELQLHGGRAVTEAVAEALVSEGLRPAEPGEFTRRAFLNGRMDLLEAEAVADLVEADTAAQRRQALRQLDGELGRLYRGWAARIMGLLAVSEAQIDFPDETADAGADGAEAELAALGTEIEAHLVDGRRGERVRTGLVLAVIGPPNVGKSSLVNALVGRDVAIVAPTAGTTRDAIETVMQLAGVRVTLIDTAGLRETSDPVEAEGVRRARDRAASADLVIRLTDGVASCAWEPGDGTDPVAVIDVRSKADLAAAPGGALAVSVMTRGGLDALMDVLAAEARRLTDGAGSPPLTRARHRAALRDAAAHLATARSQTWHELRADALRRAVRAIGRITGEVGVEDVLDSIFWQFCIGK